MKAAATFGRLISMLAFTAACSGAGAQAVGSESVVWIENESFGFDACATSTAPTGDDVVAAIAQLRARATADIEGALRSGGLVLDGEQFMTLTPLSGSLACGAADSQVIFRVAAVDRHSGKFWSADMMVHSSPAAPDAAAVARLGNDLARHFSGVQTTRAASL